MNLRAVILAFLAARSPAAYTAPAILARILHSGLLDAPPTEQQVSDALTELAGPQLGKLVDVAVAPLTKTQAWWATDAGIHRWAIDGRLHVS